jgi:putative transposase
MNLGFSPCGFFRDRQHTLPKARSIAPETRGASVMAKPSRPSDPQSSSGQPRTFFVSTRTAGGRALFQTERMATLLIDVFRSKMRARKFTIHEFVIMPNHLHILMTIPGETSIEEAMQFIKGGFSFRARHELGFHGEIWQRGFSDVHITDQLSFSQHQEYIRNNPVRAGLANSPDEYPFGATHLKNLKRASASHSPIALNSPPYIDNDPAPSR